MILELFFSLPLPLNKMKIKRNFLKEIWACTSEAKKSQKKRFFHRRNWQRKNPKKKRASETVLLSRFSRAQELVLIKNLVFILPSSWLFPAIILKGRAGTVIYRWKRPTCCTARCKTDQKLILVTSNPDASFFFVPNTFDLHIKETLAVVPRREWLYDDEGIAQ